MSFLRRAWGRDGFGVAIAVTLTIAASGALSASAWGRDLELGLTDAEFESSDAATRTTSFDRAVDARAGSVLIGASWRTIAPVTRPAGFDPTDPADPGYSWATLDAAVRDASARGLQVALLVTQAPDWAEGAHRPSTADAPEGTWKPEPAKLREFGHAIAQRYSGHFVDSTNPSAGPLPPVRRFQLWAEPNISNYLNPQWKGKHPASPATYRAMLNAFYDGIKSVSKSDLVITGGTEPYGDPITGGRRLPPVVFWRELLCLHGPKLKKGACPNPAHFDIAAVNPINVGAPTRHARNPEDLSTPDIGRLKRILNRARATGGVATKGHIPIWATEIWWDSKPPDPQGVPQAKHARWLEQSFYVLWRQGVSAVFWFEVRDAAPSPSYAASPQTGLFLRDGTPKLAFQAYRFPFVAGRFDDGHVRLWGEAPGGGQVTIERKRGGGWGTVKQLRAGSDRVFTGVLALRGQATLRARQGGETSLPWRQG